jgi:hypothetical protein
MSIIILIPAVFCILALFRDSISKAFLNVYLTVFTLLPVYYYWKVAALPPITFSEAALLPLGVAIAIKEMRFWRPALSDIAMAFFLFSSFYADYLGDKETTWKFELFGTLLLALVPYMIGKVLIEQHGVRVAAVKRIVFLLFISCIFSAYEYKMGQNPFTLVFSRFFPGESFAWKTQIRWGFGRVSGPFGQSELAGIILIFGLVLALWLGYYHLWEKKFSRPQWWPFQKATTITWIIALTLLMTQARGPWLGTLVAVPVAFIGRSKRIIRTAVITSVILVVGGGVAYVGLKHYTSGPTTSAEQENAQYRAQLITNYLPVAIKGGAWGGGPDFPRVGSQGSIDNEYLFVALVQGWVGLFTFTFIALESLVRLILATIFAPTKPDRYFACSMLGIMLGLLLTIFTVFLGNQPYELFFLLAGWSQALPLRPRKQAKPAFEVVYT